MIFHRIRGKKLEKLVANTHERIITAYYYIISHSCQDKKVCTVLHYVYDRVRDRVAFG